MLSGSPLEILLDLDSAPLTHALIGLALACAMALAWFFLHRDPSTRRYAGALAFLGLGFATEVIVPWLDSRWKAAMTLRAAALFLFLFGLVRALVDTLEVVARQRQGDVSSIFRELATLVAYGIVILVVARLEFSVDVTPLLATSALVTAVVGLALQETLGNVFSGLSLQLQKPFAPGDWVRFGNYLGRVQGIGWRSTRLVTRALERLEVPNGLLARDVITNYRGNAVGDDLFVGISYEAPPNRVKEIILRVLRHNADVARSPQPQVWVVEYGDFAVKYRIRFWMIDYSAQDRVRDEIMTRLWYALRRNGIEIPFPIRTLHVRRTPLAASVDGRQQELVAALRRVDFLSNLDESELATIVPNLYDVEFGHGETICREGESGDTFYVVRHGTVEIVADLPGGGEKHVADLHAPAFFGEMSLLTGEPRAATVRAKTDARLLVVEREGFESLFQGRPEVAEAICRILATRQSELRERREQQANPETSDSRSRKLLAAMRTIFGF
jgi:small-conductance mechanosensitive channel/CRP-like cAMP-binding protein